MPRGAVLRFGVLCATVTTAADLTSVLARAVSPGVIIAGAHVGMLGLAPYPVASRLAELLLSGWPEKVVWLTGARGDGVGVAVHGATALAILSARPGQAGTFLALSETFGAAPGIIPPVWAFGTGGVGRGFFAVVVAREKSVMHRWAAAVNPALRAMAVPLLGLATPNPKAVLALAANVAHILFFGGLLLALHAVRARGGDAAGHAAASSGRVEAGPAAVGRGTREGADIFRRAPPRHAGPSTGNATGDGDCERGAAAALTRGPSATHRRMSRLPLHEGAPDAALNVNG